MINEAIKKMNYLGKHQKPFVFIIDFEMFKPIVLDINEINNSNIYFDFNGFTNYIYKSQKIKLLEFEKQPISFAKYLESFTKVKSEIEQGNIYLVNLTFPTKINTNLTFSEIFENSRAKYKLLFDNQFVVFSPEIFVQIKDGKITSNPMKGTIDAALPNAEALIMENKKELAEHNTIVDLIRNDLNIIAKQVQVDKFRYVDKIVTNQKTLLQVSSVISGVLPENYWQNIGSLIFSLLPAGSISGAPKKKTLEVIKDSEIYTRNYYTGICGYFDGRNLDSGVMIRFIESINGETIFKSGGGITIFSDALSEYNEMIDKVYVTIY